jgi:hypothetical protein
MSPKCCLQRAYCSSPRWYISMENHGGMILTGETEELEKTCPSATLSTTNPTWTDPGTDPGLRSESPTSNRHGHSHVLSRVYVSNIHVYRNTSALKLFWFWTISVFRWRHCRVVIEYCLWPWRSSVQRPPRVYCVWGLAACRYVGSPPRSLFLSTV